MTYHKVNPHMQTDVLAGEISVALFLPLTFGYGISGMHLWLRKALVGSEVT